MQRYEKMVLNSIIGTIVINVTRILIHIGIKCILQYQFFYAMM